MMLKSPKRDFVTLPLIIWEETFAFGVSVIMLLLTFVFVLWRIQWCENLEPLDTNNH